MTSVNHVQNSAGYRLTVARRVHLHTCQIRCPQRGFQVRVQLTVDDATGVAIGVERCAMFHPNDWVECKMQCARLYDQATVPGGGNENAEAD